MTSKTYYWTAFGIATFALCGWFIRLSLVRAAIVQQLTDATKGKEPQIPTISMLKELNGEVSTARDRERRECANLTRALAFFSLEKRISRDGLKTLDVPNNYSLFTHNDLGNGFFLQSDEESEVIAFVRILPAAEGEKRALTQLKQTIKSPDSRVVLPAKLHHLTEYLFDTSTVRGEFTFGCHLTDAGGTRFVPVRGVNSRHDSYGRKGADGPYNDGILKNREFTVTYGWPDLCELDFLKALQERGIWFIGCNELYWLNEAEVLHVVLVFASKREWWIHPDYLYCRSMNSGFDLQWDPERADFLATPKSAK